MLLSQRTLALLALTWVFGFLTPFARAQSSTKPNVLFILADDLGWGDLGSYGHGQLKTPNLDRLAAEGTLFTQYYVNASVCSPSRAALMTGQFPAQLGIHGHFATEELNKRRSMPNALDPTVPTLTRLLKQNGYTTAHFGKWHLGNGPGALLPDAYGLTVHHTTTSNDPEANTTNDLWSPQRRPVATKIVVDQTIQFLEEQGAKPFYANVWLSDPHATLNPSEEQLNVYEKAGPGGTIPHRAARQIFYATVTEMDRQIGRLLAYLDQKGLAKNTILVFSSDNGPEEIEIGNASHSGVGSPGPFRGRKRSLYEGGVRVPFLVRWPARMPTRRIENESVLAGVDFLPTICRLTDTPVPATLKLDGEDRSPVWLGASQPRAKPLLWEWRYRIFSHPVNRSPVLAIRDGRWKLLLNPDRSRVELYDIPGDPSELNNLADRHPDVVERLAKQVLAWQQTLPKGPLDPEAGQNSYPWPGRSR